MILQYIRNSDIDRKKWDICIRDSGTSKPYAYSWYLDIMSPGWEAIVSGDYESVFPIPLSTRLGISYSATPLFVQQYGVFSSCRPQNDRPDDFLMKIPDSVRYIDLNISQKPVEKAFNVISRANFELNLTGSYKAVYTGFTEHCRRNIERAERRAPIVRNDITPVELISLFRKNKGREIKGIKDVAYLRLKELMTYCISNRKGSIIGVKDSSGELIYGIFIIETEVSTTMLLVVNTPESRERRTGYYIVNEIIKKYAGTGRILDFAGTTIPSVASFMESFGSISVPYYRIIRNRLPWPLKVLK